MSIGQEKSIWIRLIAWLILLLGTTLLVIAASVSYAAFSLLALGFLLAWPTRKLLPLLRDRARKWMEREGISWFALVLTALLTALVVSTMLLLLGVPHQELFLKEYAVSIKTSDLSLSRFEVHEQAVVFDPSDEENTWNINPPMRYITGTNRGLFLKEVSIIPLETVPISTTVVLRTDTCHKANAELIDFPKDLFYAAKDSENLKRYSYIDSETITWSIRSLEHGTIFSHIQPPFQYLRLILAPFIGAADLNQWIIGLLGLVVAIIVTPVIQPVLLDVARNRFRYWMEKEPEEKQTGTLIVSAKGDEKTIEITGDKR